MLLSITTLRCTHYTGKLTAAEPNALQRLLLIETSAHGFTLPPSPSDTKRLRPLKTLSAVYNSTRLPTQAQQHLV